MSSDDRTPRQDAPWRAVGAGSSVMFRCDDCCVNRMTLGRKRTVIGWRCAHCVRTKNAHKAAA